MKHIQIFEEFENEGEYKAPLQVQCNKCGWNWNTLDSDPEDMYVCHRCGENNKEFYFPSEDDDDNEENEDESSCNDSLMC